MPKKKILIAGASGLVGFAAVQHFSQPPANLHAFIGESFAAADFTLAHGALEAGPPAIVSTIKARQAGFRDCMDTEDMFRKWIRRYQELGWIPPVGV